MAKYLLSVHSVEGEAGDPMTEQEMQQFMGRVGVLEEEMKAKEIPCVVHIYPNLGHNLSIPRFFDAGKRATDFFDKHLKDNTARPHGAKPR